MGRKYRLRTLGCKVNQYESQQLRELLESHGYSRAQTGQRADLAVVNSCAVTSSASAKTRQAVRRVADRGSVPVVVVGCGATADSERLRRIPGVVAVCGHDGDVAQALQDFIVHQRSAGPDLRAAIPSAGSEAAGGRTGGDNGWIMPGGPASGRRHNSPEVSIPLVRTSLAPRPANVNCADDTSPTKTHLNDDGESGRRVPWPRWRGHADRQHAHESVGMPPHTSHLSPTISRFDGHQRAFLKTQDGCDASCTYCIIPRLRPTLRYKAVDVAVAEAAALVEAGHREIVLTGIYLGAYGRPTAIRRRFDDAGHSPLAELVDAIAGIEGLARLRLSSLEPGDVSEHLLDVLADHDCCVPHLHLPLQSGSPRILRKMNRQYDAEDFRAMIQRVRADLDRPAISTDIVVGFPGETEDDFQETLAMTREAAFCKVHAFPFSPRTGTAAARWGRDFIPGDVVRDRMERLKRLASETALQFRRQFVGSIERILVEQVDADATPDNEIACGRSDRYFEVYFYNPAGRPPGPGQLAHVHIDRVSPRRVHGTMVAAPETNVALPVLTQPEGVLQ